MGYNTQPQGGYRTQYPSWDNRFIVQPTPIVRPVSSFEEMRACPIDFDGSIFFFTDVANKRIYTKQIGMDGAAIIKMYEQKEIQSAVEPLSAEYVTKQEFQETIQQLIAKLPQEQVVQPKKAAIPQI